MSTIATFEKLPNGCIRITLEAKEAGPADGRTHQLDLTWEEAHTMATGLMLVAGEEEPRT